MSTSLAVIVTSYNYRDFIAEAIDGALAQTRPPQQIIVVDDGSTDGSPDYLRERYGNDARVTLVAFQRGVAAATADVLCFLDADDRWAPEYLAKLGTVYDNRKDVGFVFSDIVLFGNEQRRIGYADKPVDLGYTAISTWALTYWYGAPTSALSMRKLYAERSLDLPEQLYRTWKLCADNCLVYGASLFGARKYFLPTGDVGYRIHGNNGWWSNRGPTSNFLNRLHSRGLIGHYARTAGIDDSCLELSKLEYKTKPAPDWAETKRYMRLCMRGPSPWWKKIERALSILAGRKRAR
jgi:glycosyltransferase involved in cell wall biosynthesis